MSKNKFKLKSLFSIYLVFQLLLTGCNNTGKNIDLNSNEEENIDHNSDKKDYKIQYYDENMGIEIKELTSLKNIPPEIRARFSVTSSYNKIYFYEYLREDNKDKIKSIYSCDVNKDITTKVKSFEDKFILGFTEFNDSFVYGYLEDDNLKIVQEKDGKTKELAEATVYNRFNFSPQFFVFEDQLLFILTDTKYDIGNNDKLHINQKLISIKDDKLETLYETDFLIENGIAEEGYNQILFNDFQIQGDGKIMFQVINEKGSILFKYDKGELTQQLINNPNYLIIGYLKDNVIFFDEKENKYLIYNLVTEKTKEIDYSGPMFFTKIYNDTVMFFNDRTHDLWALCLKENGDYSLIDMEKKINDILNVKNIEDTSNFVFSDGNNILLTQGGDTYPTYSFYSITLH